MNKEITRDNYREYNAINYSKLSALSDYPAKVNEEKDWSKGLQSGDIIDTLLFDGESKFHEKYHVSTRTQDPSDTIKQIIKVATDYSDDELLKAAKIIDYGQSWNSDTVVRKIHEGGEKGASYGTAFMKEQEDAKDKKIITMEDFAQLKRATALLEDHSFTSTFFNDSWNNQVPLLANLPLPDLNDPQNKLNNIIYKGLLDGCKVENNIFKMFDLKFTSRTLSGFKSQFFKFNYYLQAGLYTDLGLLNAEEGITESATYYVVYSGAENRVGVFYITDSMLELGRKGGTSHTGRYIKGYRQLSQELLWHQQHDKWDYPYEVYKNNGIVNLEFNSYG